MLTAVRILAEMMQPRRRLSGLRPGMLSACACLLALLAGCGEPELKRCEVSVLSIKPGAEMPAMLLGSLLNMLHGTGEQPSPNTLPASTRLLVTLKVTNPNGRSVEILSLSGVLSTAEGVVGAFRLPPGARAMLPARGATVLDIEVLPDAAGLRLALPLLLSGGTEPKVTASGQLQVSTWLGARQIPFSGVTVTKGGAGPPSPPKRDRTQEANAT